MIKDGKGEHEPFLSEIVLGIMDSMTFIKTTVKDAIFYNETTSTACMTWWLFIRGGSICT